MDDQWQSGDIYERFMGRWSRPIAASFIDWLEVDGDASWLDVGCGTGALTDIIANRSQPSRLAGVDPAPAFVETASARLEGSVDLRVADAAELPFDDADFDVVVSGLAVNFFPDPDAGLRDMARVARPGATVAVYAWDYAEGMKMLRLFWDVATALDPGAADLDEAVRFPLCNPEPLQELFVRAGLGGVRATALQAETRFEDFDDFWEPFLGGQGPAPTYVASLAPADREDLASALRLRLEPTGDGSIMLGARAWAVAGIR